MTIASLPVRWDDGEVSRGTGPTIGEELAARRRRLFVGRAAEVALWRAALDDEDPGFRVLHVAGPGGIGKTVLLGAFADAARASGGHVVELSGRDLEPLPVAVLAALAEMLDVPPDNGPITTSDGQRLVLLVDGYEHLLPLDDWVRDELLPRLPADAVVALAGRAPPGPGWRADPAWSEHLRASALRNLDAEDSRDYLRRRGVPPGRCDEIVHLTYGHPLALSMVSALVTSEPSFSLDPLPGDVVRLLLAALVSEVPSASHRAALEATAIARSTDEDLLRHVLPDADAAHDRFNWLASQAYLEPVRDGVAPHDLVRDLLDAEARWRDRDGYRTRFRAVQEHALTRARGLTGTDQQRAVADLKFCFRHVRSVVAPVSWGEWQPTYPDPARPEDRQEVLEVLLSVDGEESASLAAEWWDRQPEAFWVIREAGRRVRGLVAMLDLTRATATERASDPGTAAAWSFVEAHAPARPGDMVTQCRFIADTVAGQGPSPTLDAVPILTLQRQLSVVNLAWDFVTLADPDQWNDFFFAADLPRAQGADFTVDGRRSGLFAHDFRRVPVEAMVRRWTERALADDAMLTPADSSTELLVLARQEFGDAVRQGLRDLHRPDLLARNPLQRTRLLVETASPSGEAVADLGSSNAARLDDLLRAAVADLADDPRDDPLLQALRCTYLTRFRTQEAAAAAMGMPFSTYRRHLTRGVDRVVEALWRRELGAPLQSTRTGGEQE